MWHLFAADSGPCQTLEGLATHVGFTWGSKPSGLYAWEEYMQRDDVCGIVVGTSRSESGFAYEVECRIAARRLGLPVVCIEDYPGNYQHFTDGEVDLLILESYLAVSSTIKRFGSFCPKTAVGASFRYDYLRQHTGVAASLRPKSRNLLWIGQPETQDALISLSRLLPFVKDLELKLMFRSHPRDLGYSQGYYSDIFSQFSETILDVSTLSIKQLFGLHPCLTLTHFSSLAIEFGFHGIPSLHLLFPDAGGARLNALAGYGVPHLCEAGASIAISSEEDLGLFLPRLIEDGDVRMNMMRRFDYYFDTAVLQTSNVISRIQSFSIPEEI